MRYGDYLEFTFYVICLAALAGLLALFGVAATADHSPRGYYLSGVTVSGGACAASDKNWDDDILVFCSTDISKVLDVIDRANTQVRKK